MTIPDDIEPFTVQYARFAEGQERALKLPARPWKALKISLTISTICGLVLLLGSEMVLVLFAFVGFISSMVALVAAVITIGRNHDDQLPQTVRLSGRRCLCGLVGAAALLGCNLLSCGVVNQRFRESILSTISGANLRGIALAVDQYHRDAGTWPVSGNDLIGANLIAERNLAHPADISAWRHMGTQQFVPSYVLLLPRHSARPRPTEILGYERQPLSIDAMRLFPEQIHSVVYMDGTIARLSSPDLASALAAQSQSSPAQP